LGFGFLVGDVISVLGLSPGYLVLSPTARRNYFAQVFLDTRLSRLSGHGPQL